MALPANHFSDITSVNTYNNNTASELVFNSVVSSIKVKFPAFLTDFLQTFDPTWNTEDVFGRMDPIATYQGTKRTISLGFDVIAGELKGAQGNLANCSKLVKMVYPVYSKRGGNRIIKPPLVRLRFANLITGRQTKDSHTIFTPQTSTNEVQTTSKEKIDGTAYTIPGEEHLSEGYLQTEGTMGTKKVTADKTATRTTTQTTQQTTTTYATTHATKTGYMGLLGYVSGLNWRPVLEMGMFTSGKDFFPKVISISFSFNVLHEENLSQDVAGVFPFKN